jgi:hypothetical protein
MDGGDEAQAIASESTAPWPQVGGEVGWPKNPHALHGTKIKEET